MASPSFATGTALRTLLTTVGVLLGTLVLTPPGQAVNLVTPLSNMMWAGTGYLYVQAGETVTLDLRTRGGVYTATMADGTPVAFVSPVDGADAGTTCAAPCGATVTATAASAGVWVLTSTVGEPFNTGITYPQIISVSAPDGTEIPGRFWTETLMGIQHRYGIGNLSVWAVSASGSQYEIKLLGISATAASSISTTSG